MTDQQIPQQIRTALKGLYEPREARAIGRLMLEVGFGVSQTSVYTGKIKHFSPNELARLHEMLQRLKAHEPVQYVLGQADFDGLTLSVGPGVLIPRPETQELVAWVAAEAQPRARVLDVGTGSGCIALALARRLPLSDVTAWDLSPDALRQAAANAWRLKLSVAFQQQDLMSAAFEGSDEPRPTFDVIVSNPPYVRQSERASMPRNVLQYEPEEALFVPDADPLCFYRALVRLCVRRMRGGGALYVEVNEHLGRETAALLAQSGLRGVELRRDEFGRDRMIRGYCP